MLIKNYRPDIDGLRAIAVLAVVFFHTFPSQISGGFLGVDIFFVISGFLITDYINQNINNNSFNLLNFYKRRILRIFPALLLVLTFSIIFGWLILYPIAYQNLAKHILGAVSFISNFILYKEAGYFDIPSEQKPLLHLWSLGVEEQFYIFLPFLLLIIHRFKLNFLLILMIVLSLALNIRWADNQNLIFYMPITRAYELLLGSLLAHHSNIPNSFLGLLQSILRKINIFEAIKLDVYFKNILSILGLIMIFYSLFMFPKDTFFSIHFTMIVILGSFLIISAGPWTFVNRYLLSVRQFVFIGKISYPLYLWHWPLLGFVGFFLRREPPESIKLIILVLSILFAYATDASP